MSLCLNPECQSPENDPTIEICINCGSKLLLRDRYRATRVIGQGGFGKTFLAIDQDRLQAHCVIKQFLPHVQGTGALEKATELFNQEAVRLYELGESSQIPTLLAYFTQEKRQYLVQEFVPGMNLLKLLEKHGRFSESEIWTILQDLLPVLQFVHDHQVIHRDIKPENIIRRQGDNRLVLIDFGVAKLLTSNTRVMTGTSIGTSGYVPLEQMSEGKVYPSSDIYSLGVTCFHLVSGVNPYTLFLKRGYSWLKEWQSHLSVPISPELCHILDRMLQEDRNNRYSDAAEALAELPMSPSGDRQIRSPTNDDEDYILSFFEDAKMRQQAPTQINPVSLEAPPTEIAFQKIFDNLVEESSEPEDDQFITEFVQAIQAKVVDEIYPADLTVAVSSSRRKEEITIAQMWRCLRTLRAHAQGVSYVAIKANGQTLLSAGVRRGVKRWDIDSGESIGNLIAEDTCSTCSGLGKVPKDATLLFVKTRQMVTCPDCEGFGINSEKGERFLAVKMSAHSNYLVLAALDKALKFWDLTVDKFAQSITNISSVVQLLALSADGKIVAYVTASGVIVVYGLGKQQEIDRLQGHPTLVTCLDMSREGQVIVSGGEDGAIILWKIGKKAPPLKLPAHTEGISAIALSSDQLLVVSGDRGGSVKVWNLVTGSLVHFLHRHTTAISAISLSADMTTLATGSSDGMVCLWHLGRGELITTLEGHTDRVTSIAPCPNGQFFVSGSLDGTIRVWRSY